MSVANCHPEYTRMMPEWVKCRDASKGQRAIHAAGEKYLPKLSGQKSDEYTAYKRRATFFNATWRTIDGLRGMIFRKSMSINVPEALRELLKDVALDGRDLHMFMMDVVQDILEVGRIGLFIDSPVTSPGMTKADAQAQKIRPTAKDYKAESIINWKRIVVNGNSVLGMVVLKELVNVSTDEFSEKLEERFRVLDLTPLQNGSVVKYTYRVRMFKVEQQGGKMVDVPIGDPVFPIVSGKTLDYIPFYFIGTDNVSCEVDNPPLIDLVDVNLSHYMTTADYEHGCHFTGLPTPYIAGHRPENDEDGAKETFGIGSSEAWVFQSAQVKVGYLEFTGQGLASLEKNLARKENQMAVLGARMLEAQRSTTESANTATIRQGGEQSMLASITACVSIAATTMSKELALFAEISDSDIEIALNKDFFPFPMDSLMMTAYVAAWQNQAISYQTMYEMLKRAEVVPQERKFEEEQKMIKDNPPPVDAEGMDGAAAPNLKVGGKVDDKTQTELRK